MPAELTLQNGSRNTWAAVVLPILRSSSGSDLSLSGAGYCDECGITAEKSDTAHPSCDHIKVARTNNG